MIISNSLLSASNDVEHVEAGRLIMREGDVGKCAYILLSGKLRIDRKIKNDLVTVGEVLPVDIVGELAILEDIPRTATVIAIEPSSLLPLNKHRLRTIIRRYPDIAEIIIKLLCSKLRNTSNRLIVSQNELNCHKRDNHIQESIDSPLPEVIKPDTTDVKENEILKGSRMATIKRRRQSK